MSNSFIRARREDGSECVIDLIELEDALEGVEPGEYYFLPGSGKVVFLPSEDSYGLGDIDESDEGDEHHDDEPAPDPDALPLDPISSRTRFKWMEDFITSVHSITAQSALRNALRQKKPFRHFKDALMEYPAVRQQWFQFQAERVKAEAVALIEGLGWEILEVSDARPNRSIPEEIDPAERVPSTSEEYEWILRGASEIAARGGRTQLALLLKGSRDKSVLKHHLDHSPAYGKLSFLTIEEIQNRIDQVIRKNDLRLEFFGDLPLIVLTDAAWERVRPWSNAQECAGAAAAGDRALSEIVTAWRTRKKDEQYHLLDAVTHLDHGTAKRILMAWHEVAGKEVRGRIEMKLRELNLE